MKKVLSALLLIIAMVLSACGGVKYEYKDGVMYDKLYSGARVVFEKNYDIGAAPEGWKKKVMENGKKVGIYVNPPHVNYAKGMRIDQYKKWKAKYMILICVLLQILKKKVRVKLRLTIFLQPMQKKESHIMISANV